MNKSVIKKVTKKVTKVRTEGTPQGNIKKLHELDVIVDAMFADDEDKRVKLKSAIKEAQMNNLFKLMAEYTKKETK